MPSAVSLMPDEGTAPAVSMAGYVPALDGIRAIAVLLVFLFHARVPGFTAGYFGVDVFFVLSGFLITSLILSEIDRTGTLSYTSFMWRRFVRLTPALLAMLFVFVTFAQFFPVVPDDPLLQAFLAAFYLADYGAAFFDTPDEIGHAWSLAVEAKFYLIWPLVVLALARRVSAAELVWIVVGLALLATVWRAGNVIFVAEWKTTYFRFDTRLSGLLAGAALASALRSGVSVAALRWLPMMMIVPLVALQLLQLEWDDGPLLIWGCTVYEVATLVLIASAVCRPGLVARGLAFGPLVWLGRMSYGFYLWHYPVIRWLREVMDWPGVTVVGFGVSLLLAWLSSVTVERAAMRYRNVLATADKTG